MPAPKPKARMFNATGREIPSLTRYLVNQFQNATSQETYKKMKSESRKSRDLPWNPSI